MSMPRWSDRRRSTSTRSPTVTVGKRLPPGRPSGAVDDGPGVPEAIRDSLFYPLVTGRSDGTGLGLAIAQEIVTRNGGAIEFQSEPGHTVFAILLPLETRESES